MDPVTLQITAEVNQALEAVKKLRDAYLDSNAKYVKSNTELEHLLNRLSGDRIIRAAAQYVGVIKEIGGVTALTEKEQAKVNKVLSDAAEKFRALGRTVPAEMQKIIAATAGAGKKINEVFVTQFSGAKIAGDALKIVDAINKIGGAAKLTDKELKLVKKTLEEAAIKSAKMGEALPANIKKVLDDVRKLSVGPSKFGGEAIIKQANDYAEAVKKVGGANRLTEAEQAKVNKVLQAAADKYRALGQQVPKDIQHILDATRQVGQTSSIWSGLWKQIAGGVTVGTLVADVIRNAVTGAMNLAISAVEGLGKAFIYLVQRGSEIQKIGTAFQTLVPSVRDAQGVQQKYNEVLEAGRKGMQGLATDFDIMKTANKGILLGLPLTAKNFEILTGAALQLGRAMGLETATALDNLIVSLGRSSPRILDNLGIIVKIGEANKRWVESYNALHKGHEISVKDMTAENKTMAFYEEALRKIQARLDQMGPITLSLAEKFQVISVAVQNFRDRLALAVSVSPVLNKAMDEIGKALIRNLGGSQEDMIRGMVSVIDSLAIAAVKTASVILKAVAVMATGFKELVDSWKADYAALDLTILGLLANLELVGKVGKYLPTGGTIFAALEVGAKAASKSIVGLLQDQTKVLNGLSKGAKAVADGSKAASKFLDDLVPKLEEARKQQVTDLQIHNAMIMKMNERGDAAHQLSEKEKKAAEKIAKAWKKTFHEVMTDFSTVIPGIRLSNYQMIPQAEVNRLMEQAVYGGLTKKQWDQAQHKRAEIEQLLSNAGPPVLSSAQTISMKETIRLMSEGAHWTKAKSFADTFTKSLKAASRAFSEMAQISDGAIGKMMKNIGEFIAVLNIGVQAADKLHDAWGKTIAALSTKNKDGTNKPRQWKDAAAGLADMALAVPQIIAAMDAATDKAKKSQRIISGALSGAAIGNSIIPGWGALGGALVGALIGAFRKRRWAEVMKSIGKEYGKNITEEMAKQIEADAKTIFGGDFEAAKLSHLADIIGPDGLNSANLDKMTMKLHDIFSMIQTGKMTVDQARDAFDKAFPLFVEQIQKEGGIADKSIHDLIRLNKEYGLESKAIMDFIRGEMDKFATALGNIMAPRLKGITSTIEELKKNKDRLKELQKESEGGDGLSGSQQKEMDELTKKIKEGEAAIGSYGNKIKDFGLIISGTFKGALNEGLTYDEAFGKIQGDLTTLIPIYDELKARGYDFNNVLFEQLIAEAKIVEKNPELAQAAASFKDLFASMSNLEAFDPETFAATERSMLDVVQQMQEAGFSQEAILRRIAPALEQIVQLQAEYGIKVDAATQALIDQAKQHDLLGKKAKTETDIMSEGFDAVAAGLAGIIDALGGRIPDALKKFLDSANDAAAGVAGISDNLGDLPGRFDDARERGLDAMRAIRRAAEDAQGAIDAVSLGHSPGGIKEIPIKMAEAEKAGEAFRDKLVNQFSAVEGSVNKFLDPSKMQAFFDTIANSQDLLSGKLDPKKLEKYIAQVEAQLEDGLRPFDDADLQVERLLKKFKTGFDDLKLFDKLNPEQLNDVFNKLTAALKPVIGDLDPEKLKDYLDKAKAEWDDWVKNHPGPINDFPMPGGGLKYIPPTGKEDLLNGSWSPGTVVDQIGKVLRDKLPDPNRAPELLQQIAAQIGGVLRDKLPDPDRPLVQMNVHEGAFKTELVSRSVDTTRELAKRMAPEIMDVARSGGDTYGLLKGAIEEVLRNKGVVK